MNLYWFRTVENAEGYAVADTLGVVDDSVGPVYESKLLTQNVLILSPSSSVVSVGKQSVKVTACQIWDCRKIDAIKAIRQVTGLGLKEAKEALDTFPSELFECPTQVQARWLISRLSLYGYTAEEC